MDSNDNPNNPFACEPTGHKFGDVESSDVTFVVGTELFECHKETLCRSSSYFTTMFTADFKEKDQTRISIDEDPALFKMLLDDLYKEWAYIQDDLTCCQKNTLSCLKGCCRRNRSSSYSCCVSSKLWLRCPSMLYLYDKYILDKMITHLEEFLEDIGSPMENSCTCDGVKLFVSMFWRTNKPKKRRKDDFRRLAGAVPVLKMVQPDLTFEWIHLEWVLEQELKTNARSNKSIMKHDRKYSSTPLMHSFGEGGISDVTFVVGGEEFHCHKMFLAARSPYFNKMFYSSAVDFHPDTVLLEEDAVVFSQLLSILYDGRFSTWRNVIDCGKGFKKTVSAACEVTPKIWKTFNSLVKLAEKLGVRDHVVAFLDACFMCNLCAVRYHPQCTCAGVRYIIAGMHGFPDYSNSAHVTRVALVGALSVIKKMDPDFTFDLDIFELLLKKF